MFARSSLAPAPALFVACAFLGFGALTACGSSTNEGGTTGDTGVSKDTSAGDTLGLDTSVGPDTGGGGDARFDTAPKPDTGTVKDGDSGGPTISSCDPHTGDECNMVTQAPCSGGDTCDYNPSKGHNTCGKLPLGVVGKGEACSTSNPCDVGLFCYDGKCSPPCCPGDNSVCGGEGKCNLSITEPTDGGADKVLYHVCTYPAICHPFKFDCPTNQVCLFATEPDSFSCATPTSTAVYAAGPEAPCKYANDCGESQLCTELTTGGDAGSAAKCYLFCWLTPKADAGDAGSPLTGGRFAADGTCTIKGKNYGTCTSIGGIGGGLGLCVK